MKKIRLMLAAFSTAMMMLAVPACAAETDYTGDWYGDFYGTVIKMTLNEDGTFTTFVAGEEDDGVWEMTDEGLRLDGQLFTITEDGLSVEVGEDNSMTFGREPLEAFVPAEIDYEADIELLQGKWSAYKMGSAGFYIDVAPGDLSHMEMEITGKTVSMNGFFFDDETYEMEEQDGGLSIFSHDESEMFQIMAVNYLTDGTVRLALVPSIDSEDGQFEYLFIPAEEVENMSEAATE